MTSESTSESISKKTPARWRARRFMIEVNQIDKYPQLKANLMSRRAFRYMVVGREFGEDSGKEHYHIYVEFTMTTILTQKTVLNQHVDPVKSQVQGEDYCTKDCEIVERIGEPAHQGCKYTFDDFRKTADPSEIPIYYFRTWTAIRQYNQSMTKSLVYKPGIKVFYIWGDSGVGKTKYAMDQLKDDEPFDRVKYCNGFWTGVSMDESVRVAIYDDFRDSHMKPSEFINFIDYYANNLNLKGTHVLNHYMTIFITSVQSPQDLYKGMLSEEPRKQWLRRMEIIHLQ